MRTTVLFVALFSLCAIFAFQANATANVDIESTTIPQTEEIGVEASGDRAITHDGCYSKPNQTDDPQDKSSPYRSVILETGFEELDVFPPPGWTETQ